MQVKEEAVLPEGLDYQTNRTWQSFMPTKVPYASYFGVEEF
jgi:hypothetical protein